MMDGGTFSILMLSGYVALMILFPIILWIIAKILSPQNPNPVKNAPFECAQVSVGKAHERFMISYYPYAMIYAIFGAFAVLLVVMAPHIIQYKAGLDFSIIMLAVITIALMSAAVSLRSLGRH